ncbi:MAG: phosphatidylserine decarboxylase [Legionellales bacterium]|nr:phosphatidylserine decarboxylase [Legionellales bacterium]
MFNIFFQNLLPKKLLGKICIFLAHIKITPIKNLLISIGLYFYKLNMKEAIVEDPYSYKDVETLFIRQLKPNVRNFDQHPNSVCSPCDGTITEINYINSDSTINAKGHTYSVDKLLASNNHPYQQGFSTTIYLAPTDYHRVHMPMSGTITSMTYIPGKLYSVNPKLYDKVPSLLTNNERVIINAKNDLCCFTLVLIGAINVGNICIKWHGLVNSEHPISMKHWDYQPEEITLSKGDELGYFTFGSTVVLVVDQSSTNANLKPLLNNKILLGEILTKI